MTTDKLPAPSPVDPEALPRPLSLDQLRLRCSVIEQRFCEELVAGDYKIARAYARIRPQSKRPDVAGSKMFHRPHVRAYADALHASIAQRLGIDATRTLRELGRLAFANAQDYFDADGNLIAPHHLDRDAAAAIAEFKTETVTLRSPSGRKKRRVTRVTYKLHNKTEPLRTIAQHFNMLDPDRRLPQNPTGATTNVYNDNRTLIVTDAAAVRGKIDKLIEGISSRMEKVER